MFHQSNIKHLLLIVIAFVPGAVATENNAPVVELSDQDIQQRLQRLERMIDNQSLLDLYNQVQRLQEQVRQLQGENETQRHMLDEMTKRQKELYADIDRRLQEVTGGDSDSGDDDFAVDDPLMVEGAVDDTDSGDEIATVPDSDTADDAAAAATDTEGANTAYSEAFNLLKAGKYQEANSAFAQYLETYPNSEYADNAQYWLGESHYVMRNFEEAVAAYRRLIDIYPDSQKVPHAMLKIGYSQHELGDTEQARQILQSLRSEYPDSTAASLAQERLQQMQAGS